MGERGLSAIALPQAVRDILQTLQGAGFAAYAVGGCVRDSLLGLTPQDWDICTAARPEETAACFSDRRVLLTGARYGTVTLFLGEEGFEITTFRAESDYLDARHPSGVRFLESLQADLARRDFTVNAMAADETGRVVDPFGGQADLARGILRCVGAPSARFSEDALRILRALRFSARFDLQIEEETAEALHAQRERLAFVARERVQKELCGLLCAKAAGRILREFPDVLGQVLPELLPCVGFDQKNAHHLYDVWTHTSLAVDAAPQEKTVRLALLLHDLAKPACFTLDEQGTGHFYGHAARGAQTAAQILSRLCFDRETVTRVSALVAHHSDDLTSPRVLRRLIAALGEEDTQNLLQLCRADRIATGTRAPEKVEEECAEWTRALQGVLTQKFARSAHELALGGRELMALGLRGAQIGQMQKQMLEAVLDGALENTHDALLCFVRARLAQS